MLNDTHQSKQPGDAVVLDSYLRSSRTAAILRVVLVSLAVTAVFMQLVWLLSSPSVAKVLYTVLSLGVLAVGLRCHANRQVTRRVQLLENGVIRLFFSGLAPPRQYRLKAPAFVQAHLLAMQLEPLGAKPVRNILEKPTLVIFADALSHDEHHKWRLQLQVQSQ